MKSTGPPSAATIPDNVWSFLTDSNAGEDLTVDVLRLSGGVAHAAMHESWIVAPGSLVEQWQDEMAEKFGLDFTVFSREQVEQSRGGNPFDDVDLMVARLDQLSRSASRVWRRIGSRSRPRRTLSRRVARTSVSRPSTTCA